MSVYMWVGEECETRLYTQTAVNLKLSAEKHK